MDYVFLVIILVGIIAQYLLLKGTVKYTLSDEGIFFSRVFPLLGNTLGVRFEEIASINQVGAWEAFTRADTHFSSSLIGPFYLLKLKQSSLHSIILLNPKNSSDISTIENKIRESNS